MLILEANAICLQYPLKEVVEALNTPLTTLDRIHNFYYEFAAVWI